MDEERYSRMVQCYDNFLDKEDLDFLRNYLLYECSHNFVEYSNRDLIGGRFYSTDFSMRDKFIMSIFHKIACRLNVVPEFVDRVHSNIQHYGMGGNYHNDDTNNTCILMVTGDVENGFEYLDENNNTQLIDFVPNKLIYFNGKKISHRGLPPKTQTPRVTLAFKFD